ncbi:MAG: hypothetical protein ACOX5R_10800 [bacterium]|jgi:predicted RNase H-like HicB family nuclease
MRYQVRLRKQSPTEYVVQTIGEPDCRASGTSREDALEEIKNEIRYRVEYCPCAWVPDDFVELEVIEE